LSAFCWQNRYFLKKCLFVYNALAMLTCHSKIFS